MSPTWRARILIAYFCCRKTNEPQFGDALGGTLKIVAIIQARMGSTRLPGKVLLDLEGETVLARVVHRVQRASLINEVLVATTDGPADDVIVQECRRVSVPVFRGDEKDVLDRYFRAAQLTKADVVVRITSDCPLIDPGVTGKTIAAFLEAKPDYASNSIVRRYPRGLDTEVMKVQALERAWRAASRPYEREHVTPYLYEHPAEFKILPVTGDADHSQYRWTLDTPEDLEFIRAVYARMKDHKDFLWTDVLALLDREPQLVELNRSVEQKDLRQG
jgi:spore coat polysaccharide biosynthesis protein SpsF